MNWKRWSCCFMTLGCLLAWGTRAPLVAGEIDAMHLLNLLQKKGVITQEESNDLMKEVRDNAKKEKTELKEELKSDAAKGTWVPSALKDLRVGATIFGEWNSKNVKNGASTNDFNVNRAYLTLRKGFTPWLDMRLTTDLFTSKDADDKGNGLEVRMKYAYFNLKFGTSATEIGLVHTPSDDYDSAIWPYRVQGKHFLDNNGIQSSADLGIMTKGTFGGNMDKEYLDTVSNAYAGKWGGYMVGIYNGAGYDNTEANTDKAISALIYFRPAPMVSMIKGLQFAYYGNYGKSNANFTAAGRTADFPDWQVNIGQVSWQHKLFALMGQYYWGKGTKSSTDENEKSGYVGAAYMKIPGLEKLRIFGKYEYFDPNTKKDKDGFSTYIAGLSYDVTRELMPFFAYENRQFEASGGADYTKYQVGFQFNF